MEKFRVWEGSGTLRSGEYKDVKGKDYMTIATRFFGKSDIKHGDDGTATVTKNGSVQGYIRKMS